MATTRCSLALDLVYQEAEVIKEIEHSASTTDSDLKSEIEIEQRRIGGIRDRSAICSTRHQWKLVSSSKSSEEGGKNGEIASLETAEKKGICELAKCE